MTVQGPVKKQQPDGMSHRGLEQLFRKDFATPGKSPGHRTVFCFYLVFLFFLSGSVVICLFNDTFNGTAAP